jgi:hypothetical protein
MKLKSIRVTFFILAGLVIASFGFLSLAQESSTTTNNIFLDSDQDGLSDEEEKTYDTDPQNKDTDCDGYSDGTEVRSGFDPKKPGPDDRIIAAQTSPISSNDSNDEGNLTKEVSQKISDIITTSDSNNQEISLEQVKELVSNSLSAKTIDEDLIYVSPDEIKIIKQNYANLSEKQILEKKKEALTKYVAAVYYILSSNSPTPVTSGSDINNAFISTAQKIVFSISSNDAAPLDDLSRSGENILEQLKEVEVPEELVAIHLKAMGLAKYSFLLKDNMKPSSDDPLSNLADLSKISGLMNVMSEFYGEIEAKMNEYSSMSLEIATDLEKLGLPEIPSVNSDDILGSDTNP